jgi:glycosyltransferase involved in cell wall biosynthesis
MRSSELAALRVEIAGLASQLEAFRADAMSALAAAIEHEPETRRRLRALRARTSYVGPFSASDPLVSICIPTYENVHDLVSRAIPSALDQEHEGVEVVVVGDGAPPETAKAVEALGDPRVRYENLPHRGTYPDDDIQRWYVAGTPAFNRAIELARGDWFVILNDDDALRPNHVARLLDLARETRAEVAYGKLLRLAPEEPDQVLGAFPPAPFAFGWQAALQHRAMRLFEYELVAAVFREPGDGHRLRRMQRAGVRFTFLDEIVANYYPARLWAAGR